MAAPEAACSSSWQAWRETEWEAVLSREDELRLCPETQAAYAAAEEHTSSIDWLTVTEGLQERVLLEAGVPAADITAALAAMWSALYRCVFPMSVCCLAASSALHAVNPISRQPFCPQHQQAPSLEAACVYHRHQ